MKKPPSTRNFPGTFTSINTKAIKAIGDTANDSDGKAWRNIATDNAIFPNSDFAANC